jgi:hypothetical protein
MLAEEGAADDVQGSWLQLFGASFSSSGSKGWLSYVKHPDDRSGGCYWRCDRGACWRFCRWDIRKFLWNRCNRFLCPLYSLLVWWPDCSLWAWRRRGKRSRRQRSERSLFSKSKLNRKWPELFVDLSALCSPRVNCSVFPRKRAARGRIAFVPTQWCSFRL